MLEAGRSEEMAVSPKQTPRGGGAQWQKAVAQICASAIWAMANAHPECGDAPHDSFQSQGIDYNKIYNYFLRI